MKLCERHVAVREPAWRGAGIRSAWCRIGSATPRIYADAVGAEEKDIARRIWVKRHLQPCPTCVLSNPSRRVISGYESGVRL